MLDVLRKRKRSWIITIFLGLIVFTFVLYFGGRLGKDPGAATLATVNGETVDRAEFELDYQRLVEFYRDLYKTALTPEMLKSLNLRGMLLEELIQKRLLLQEARRLGLEVQDEEVMDAIARVPEFQDNGRFNKDRYLQVLRARRLTPAQFETEQRERVMVQKLYTLILDAVGVTEGEVRDRYRVGQERVNFYFVRLSPADFVSRVEIKDEDIKNYYDRNREALKEPLKVQVEYVVYPFDQFAAKLQISDQEVEDYYKANRDTRFHQSKAVHLRHILFRVPPEAKIEQKMAVRTAAEAVQREARTSKDFAQLAKQHSEDPSSVQGGDLGWVTPGQLPPLLEKAAFGLKRGEVSAVVESPLGYHIFKVEETKEEKTKSLQEAREEIIQSLRAERGKIEAGRAADQDREKALSGGDFAALAKAREIPFKVSPLFSRSDRVPEVDPPEAFAQAAFSLGQDAVSSPIEGKQAYYLMKLKQRKEPAVPPMEAVRAEIEKRLRAQKASELASNKANELLAQLKKEKDINQVANKQGLSAEETGWFVRGLSEIPKLGSLQEMKPGEIPISAAHPISDRVYSEKGDLYVFAFKESQGADMERFEKEKNQLEEAAFQEKRQRALQKFLESLKGRAQIQIQPSFLEQS